MLPKKARQFKVLILVLALLPISVIGTLAKSPSIRDVAAVQESTSEDARADLPTTLKQIPQRNPCNAKRRALIGAAIGAVIGMVAVQKAAKANDGTVGVKGTLHAGGYGAALGGFVGLKTCP
jgi:hypothetical protein